MIKCIRSVMFLFRCGKSEERVSVKSCTGWVMYPIRLRKNRVYTFSFDVSLSEGSAEAVLIKKRQNIKLDADSDPITLEIHENSWAFVRWNFKGASGECTLHRNFEQSI
ncbi:MAG: hypothetical protein ACI4YB_09380 [Oscillospiraceae bacterium]